MLPQSIPQQALVDAVVLANGDEALIGRRGFGVPIRRPGGDPAILNVLPLKHGVLRSGLSPSAVAGIFIAPATASHPAPERALAALFDLTPSEARMFSQIAAGRTIAEAAVALHIAPSTARSHLHQIFGKTATRRQADLVRLATSLSSIA